MMTEKCERCEANKACKKVWKAYAKAWEARNKAREAWEKAYRTYNKACDRAYYLKHADECPKKVV